MKLKNVSFEDIQEGDTDTDDNYLLVKYKIFKDLFTKVAACPKCNLRTVIISDKLNERMGLEHKIILYCSEKKCDYKDELYMDNLCKTERCTQGRQPYESNVPAVIGFREIGHGHSRMRNVLRCMNIHPISSSAFTSLNEQVAVAHDNAANNSMRNAAAEVRQRNPVPNPCIIPYSTCRVSVDGPWQRRGHESLNGLVTCISEGKCIDIKTLTAVNAGSGKASHDPRCKLNHNNSSGAVESAGAVDIFCCSLSINKLIYNGYLGDGNSSSFVDAKPYVVYNIDPEKYECVGHVQKRLGTR